MPNTIVNLDQSTLEAFNHFRITWGDDTKAVRALLNLPQIEPNTLVPAPPSSQRPDPNSHFGWVPEAELAGIGELARMLADTIHQVDPDTLFSKDKTPRLWTSRPTNWISLRWQPRKQNIVVTLYGLQTPIRWYSLTCSRTCAEKLFTIYS